MLYIWHKSGQFYLLQNMSITCLDTTADFMPMVSTHTHTPTDFRTGTQLQRERERFEDRYQILLLSWYQCGCFTTFGVLRLASETRFER